MTTNTNAWKDLIEAGKAACGAEDYTTAEGLFIKATLEAERVGLYSAELESALGNLALFYHYFTQEYSKAEDIYIRALEVMRYIQGARSREIGNYILFLAEVQTKQGKLHEAKLLLEEHISITTEHRGESHSDTVQAYNLLVEHLRLMGNYEQAQQVEEKLNAIRQE